MKDNFNKILNKFQKALMSSGQKSTSTIILREVINRIISKNDDPYLILRQGVENVKPLFIVSSQKKGKRLVQTPRALLNEEKRIAISANWIVKNSKKHSRGSFVENLLQEIYDASQNQGFSKRKQQELNKLVVLNRASLQS